MEDLRMSRLFKHIDKMDKNLVSMFENYKVYTQQQKPTICILCSDNKLRAEVDNAFTIRRDMYINVIVTSEEIKEDDKYKVMLCDAIVVCTRAKNIAPKGLYDLLKDVSHLDKQVYVVLAGWESFKRSEKIAKSRAQRVSVEFEFARIINVINVFDNLCEGYVTWDYVFDFLAHQFLEKFEILHLSQDEKIYNYLLKYLDNFYSKARIEINDEIAILNNAEKNVLAKQDGYEVRFSNLVVSVQDVVDSIRNSIKDISYYDIRDDNKNETLTDIYLRNGVEAQKYAKIYLTKEYKKRIELIKKNSNEKVKIDNESCMKECINEMNIMLGKLSKLNYLPQNLVDSLMKTCNEKNKLEKISNGYELSLKTLIDNVLDKIPAKVCEYRYEMKYSIDVRDTGKELLGTAKNVIKDLFLDYNKDSSELHKENEKKETCEKDKSELDKTKNEANKIKFNDDLENEPISKKTQKVIDKENDESLMLNRFQRDVEQLILYSCNACGEIAQDCAEIIKNDMKSFSNSILKIYFGSIIKEIENMQIEMSKILEEYYLE